MQTNRSRNALIGFAMVFATLLANGLLTYLNVRRLYEMEQSIAQAHELLSQLDALLTTMDHAETGQRAYLLTGEPSYLEPYQSAAAAVDAQVKQIESLTTGHPAQRASAAQLVESIRKGLGSLGENIAARREQSFEANAVQQMTASGSIAVDGVREIIGQMQTQQRRQLADQAAESEVSYWTALITGLITAGLGFSLATAAYFLVERDMQTRARAAADLQAINERLEERVRQRTAEISEVNTALQAEIEVRHQAETQARRFAEELQRSNRELAQFASVASHDLQEPLRKIQAFGDRLRSQYRDQLASKGQDYLDRMLAGAGRMRKLIDDLLSYARIATKAQPFVPVNLRQVVEEVVSDLESRIQQTGGHVEIGPLPIIAADPPQMRQLFQNLLANALKFQKPDVPPVVKISAELVPAASSNGSDAQRGLQCELTVSDNGIGFEEMYGERIFGLFERLHTRDQYEGTGMGLAICKKIVERHGGRISAHSAPGQGARLVVVLPVEQCRPQEPA